MTYRAQFDTAAGKTLFFDVEACFRSAGDTHQGPPLTVSHEHEGATYSLTLCGVLDSKAFYVRALQAAPCSSCGGSGQIYADLRSGDGPGATVPCPACTKGEVQP